MVFIEAINADVTAWTNAPIPTTDSELRAYIDNAVKISSEIETQASAIVSQRSLLTKRLRAAGTRISCVCC